MRVDAQKKSVEGIERKSTLALVRMVSSSETHDLGAMCKKPAEFTAFKRLRRETNAVLCGSSISSPYRHLNRWG